MPLTATFQDQKLLSPAVGRWVPTLPVGASLRPGMEVGYIERLGRRLPVVAGQGSGSVKAWLGPAMVDYGAPILELGEAQEQAVEEAENAASTEGLTAVKAPMAGTVYLAPGPGEDNFVQTGQAVAKNARVALIEVMKTFTPITAPQGGVLERLAVQDGDTVDAGAPVAWLRPE
ncbi:MAG: biotin/lipoyl-containing protein [Myxococcota bacterium]|nr:biotin/lipoyl-containing protein [Myxococcota bacterium]